MNERTSLALSAQSAHTRQCISIEAVCCSFRRFRRQSSRRESEQWDIADLVGTKEQLSPFMFQTELSTSVCYGLRNHGRIAAVPLSMVEPVTNRSADLYDLRPCTEDSPPPNAANAHIQIVSDLMIVQHLGVLGRRSWLAIAGLTIGPCPTKTAGAARVVR